MRSLVSLFAMLAVFLSAFECSVADPLQLGRVPSFFGRQDEQVLTGMARDPLRTRINPLLELCVV
jgi:hypothetical protein